MSDRSREGGASGVDGGMCGCLPFAVHRKGQEPAGLLLPLPWERITITNPGLAGPDLGFAPADAWRAHYFSFCLTLRMPLTSKPARSSLLITSWLPSSYHPFLVM